MTEGGNGVLVELYSLAADSICYAVGSDAWALPREPFDWGDIVYWWHEGNGSCDCNRSRFFDPEWICGDCNVGANVFFVRLWIDGEVAYSDAGFDLVLGTRTKRK